MSVLIIHHVESMWKETMLKSFGVDLDHFISKLAAYLEENHYTQIILTCFEEWKLGDEHWPIAEHVNHVYDYAYGWEADMFQDESEYCDGGNHSSVVHITDWMRDLPKQNVTICGAFDGECIEDLEIALGHLDVKFDRLEEFII